MATDNSRIFKEMGARLSNWGRWGDDDERGTLNFITPEKVVQAARSVRSGKRFELSIPLDQNGPQSAAKVGANRIDPVHLFNLLPADFDWPGNVFFADDYIIMPLQSATQWDGLGHCGYDDQLYNGMPAADITPLGAKRNTIDRVLADMSGRGVLLDIARLKGVDHLEPTYGITIADLEEAEGAHGVTVGSGDILLVRTGWLGKCQPDNWKDWMGDYPGLTLEVAEWLYEREVAAVASDNASVEQRPSPHGLRTPFHAVVIRDMGMMMGEIFNLEELAEDCADDGQYDFMFVAPPLRVTGGVGSPVSPIAIK